jgi:hypothetical protein
VYLTLLALHFLGLAIGIGAGFAMLTLRRLAATLPEPERAPFLLRAAALGKNASSGFGLQLLSGLGLLILRGPLEVMRWGGVAFHIKLTLVLLMIATMGYLQVTAKKARQAGGGPLLAKVGQLSTVMLGLGVAAVIAAVIAFK